eukprot:Nitzschia sp. Nitz4//scaffold14_size191712//152365//153765//NITZ4_001749-RA/size191712-processed-gene-0.288-mRNA-1//1//CDS//3329537005//8755//frame0
MTATTLQDENAPPRRASCKHQAKWQRFQPTLLQPETKKAAQKDTETYQYQRQYSHVYSHRLAALKDRCWESFAVAANNSSSGTSHYARKNRVLELRENIPSQLVGTVVKETNDPKEEPLVADTECRPSDQLFLEDESGRVALQVENIHEYCTGAVIGVQGRVDDKGTFLVDQVVFPQLPALASPPATSSEGTRTTGATPHLLLLSSPLCGDPAVSSLPRELLLSYLQGQFTPDAAKVCRVLLVGGGPSKQDPLQGLKELDAFLRQLTTAGIPVDILPGKDDPTTANWPQRPLHSSLLPNATAIVHRAPNPYAAMLGDKYIVATDGANVHDLQKHVLDTSAVQASEDTHQTPSSTTPLEEQEASTLTTASRLSELDALHRTLEWSHICPTGPASLPTVPHLEDDPMVLDTLPHLYVAGNASAFATKQAAQESTTLMCVPSFAQTGQAVLVNMESMAVELLRFQAKDE